jgi:outer membrane biosynthesis protein TonB
MQTPDKRLLAALAFSVMAHWLFAAFAPIELPNNEEKSTVLTTRITAMPPAPTLAAAPPPKAAAQSKPKPKKTAPQGPKPGVAVASLPSAKEVDEPIAVAAAEPIVEPPKAPEKIEPPKPEEKVAEKEPEPEPTPPPPMSTAGASGSIPTVSVPDPNSPEAKAAQRLAELPRLIDLNFKAAYAQGGNYPMPIGNLKLRFEHEGDKYELRTTGQASGFFKMLYPGVMRMKSVGKLTNDGIAPDYFEMVREREGKDAKPRKVVFDREAKLIRLNEKEPVAMTGPVFDVLTFIVQFYFAIPGDKTEVSFQVVSPTRVDAYTLKRGEKETLDTPQGKIETEIWRGSRKEAAGSAEFWLAPSWHYIPFKVRMTDDQDRKASFELDSVAVEAALAKK